MHQSLHHIVADAAWSDAALLQEVRRQVLPAMPRRHGLAAWIVDDTGFPKKGSHSVGVTRQYCGQLGKQENCRIAVSVSLATAQTSLPAIYQLYLPEIWANDAERRRKAGVPEEVRFQTKPEIALTQIRSLVNEDVPRGVVLADAAYGNDNGFRQGLEALGFEYVVGVQSSTSVWPPGIAPLRPRPEAGWGVLPGCCGGMNNISRFGERAGFVPERQRSPASKLARRHTRNMHSRFARLRVRVAHRDYWRSAPHPQQWLLIEWPKAEKEPAKYWLSNLPEAIRLRHLVATANCAGASSATTRN